MLEKALKLDRVHKFGDISMSQLSEKMDWLTEIAITEGQMSANGQRVLLLFAIISLCNYAILPEKYEGHAKAFNEKTNYYQFPLSIDCT